MIKFLTTATRNERYNLLPSNSSRLQECQQVQCEDKA